MRAIILAAGKGTRLRPLTENIPKPLVKVNGKPIIETQIECLFEKGIKDIVVVTGYLAKKLDYLKGKYHVKLVYNDKYDKFNNIYTMYLVRHYLGDSYVLDGDVYINVNFIKTYINRSTYFGVNKNNFKEEWVIDSKYDKIINISVENSLDKCKTILSGISYWSSKDGNLISNILENIVLEDKWGNLYWDNIVKENLDKIEVYLQKIKHNWCFEIDTLEDLKRVEKIVLA